jgi:hypothetical protein
VRRAAHSIPTSPSLLVGLRRVGVRSPRTPHRPGIAADQGPERFASRASDAFVTPPVMLRDPYQSSDALESCQGCTDGPPTPHVRCSSIRIRARAGGCIPEHSPGPVPEAPSMGRRTSAAASAPPATAVGGCGTTSRGGIGPGRRRPRRTAPVTWRRSPARKREAYSEDGSDISTFSRNCLARGVAPVRGIPGSSPGCSRARHIR